MRTPKLGHHKASGRAVVRLNGHDYYCGEWGSQEAELKYQALVAEYKASGGRLSWGQERPTVAMVAADYADYCEEQYPKRRYSEADVIRNVAQYLEPYYDLPAEEFGPLKLKAVRQRMLEATGKHGQPLSRKYINEMVGRIVKMFKWAAEDEIIEITVALALANVRGLTRGRELEPVAPVPDETVDQTLPHCRPIIRHMIELQRLTGARPGEICKLTPDMIDRSRGAVWVADFRDHKTRWKGKTRNVLIGPKGQKIIAPYLFCDPCFGYQVSSYRRAIHRACDRAFPPPEEIKENKEAVKAWRSEHRWSPNQVRHSAATEIRRQFGIEIAGIILGHAKLETSQIYAERDLARALEVIEQIG